MQQEKAYQGCRWLRFDTIWGAASFRNYTSQWSVYLWEPGIWLGEKALRILVKITFDEHSFDEQFDSVW